MRDENAPTHPNIFSLFGGQVEKGEDSKTAVFREIWEELVYTPDQLEQIPGQLVIRTSKKYSLIYAEEVGPDFESKVRVEEGRYGAFVLANGLAPRSDVSDFAKDAVAELLKHIEKR